MPFLADLVHDLRFALRNFRRSPGFTIIAIAALALGIGATTAIFSVVNAVLLAPLPYPHADRIVRLLLGGQQGQQASLAIPEFVSMRAATGTLGDFCLYDFGGPGINLTGSGEPQQLKGIHVSMNYFSLFGAPMALGRGFSADEDRPNGSHVVVISNALWHAQFGGDPRIIGKTISLSGDPYQVVGVLGRAFTPDPPADVWLPLQADPQSRDEAHYLLGAAMLKPGVTLAQANSELKLAAAAFWRRGILPIDVPENRRYSFVAQPLRDATVAAIKAALLTLFGAVGLVLLIACSNVANLLLARATIRKREIVIRAALGAKRGRIIRQLLTESVLLALTGGICGLILGYAGVRTLLAANPGNIPRILENGAGVSLDWRVLLFTLLISFLTGILFGLVPALGASHADLSSTLKESGARAGGAVRHNKLRAVLVTGEMALSIVLLIGAVLLLRSFAAIRAVNPGFDPHNVLVMQMSLSGARFEKTPADAQMELEAERRLASIPGVRYAAASATLPLQGTYGLPFEILGGKSSAGARPLGASFSFATPQLFQVFHIPLLRGRFFSDLDTAAAPHVVIINDAFAKQFWKKGEDPLGQQLLIGGNGLGPEWTEPARQIVGIVGDVHDAGLNNNPPPIMYVPAAQLNDGVTALFNRLSPVYWTVRTSIAPFALSRQIQDQLRIASGGLPVAHIRSMEEVVSSSTARAAFMITLLTTFAAIALLLAAIGIYGVMAYSVEQRTHEIGIRMALGASQRGVRRMVVRQAMILAAIGVVVGVGASFGLTRLIASMLYGITALDPATFIVAAVTLALVAACAAYVPARRASRVDPLTALRWE